MKSCAFAARAAASISLAGARLEPYAMLYQMQLLEGRKVERRVVPS